jgi:hypothetical protein
LEWFGMVIAQVFSWTHPREETTMDKLPSPLEWADVIGDLDRLQVVEVDQDGKRFLLRSEVQGTCGTVFRAAGVAVPPTVQQAAPEPAATPPDPGATPDM